MSNRHEQMKGVKTFGPGRVDLVDVDRPSPGAGQVLLRVLGAGVCQTDLHIRGGSHEVAPRGTTLGHEIAGRVEALGEGAMGWRIGDHVVVHPVWSCGRCGACLAGRQNACRRTGARLAPPPTPGVTLDGGMADYVVAPANALVDIGDLDPAVAATLTDAALTPYGAIHSCEQCLFPGSSAVVIGLGGLGNLALQILRAITGTRTIGLDISDAAIDASRPWADHVFRADDAGAVDAIVAITEGFGADVVLDFVGTDASLAQAQALIGRYGAIRVVGLSGGVLQYHARSSDNPLPRGVSIMCPYSGTYSDLAAVVALARRGAIKPLVTRFPLARAIEAFDALEGGQIRGRAVLVPG